MILSYAAAAVKPDGLLGTFARCTEGHVSDGGLQATVTICSRIAMNSARTEAITAGTEAAEHSNRIKAPVSDTM